MIERFTKPLSATDLGKSDTHQAGIYIPKSLAGNSIFPELDVTELNPSHQMHVYSNIDSTMHTLVFIYYNSKHHPNESANQDEYRLLNVAALLRSLGGASVGDHLVLEQDSCDTTTSFIAPLDAGDASAEAMRYDEAMLDQFTKNIAAENYYVPDRYSNSKTRGSAQRAFAKRVKQNYGFRCAATGITTPDFLVASHIVPWSVDETIRLDPSNGICLSVLVDKAFDSGYLTIDEELTMRINSPALINDLALFVELSGLNGNSLARPYIAPPSPEYLRRRGLLLV